MVSARLDPALVADLRRLAEQRGISFSDVLREAAIQLLRQEQQQNVITFCVKVTNKTRPDNQQRSFRTAIPAAV
jgi:hypothetical protein